MKADEQLEQILRATFAARSDTVTGGPVWRADAAPGPDADGPVELLDLTPRRPRYRFAPLAAAAVVALAVVGLVVGVRAATEHPTPPAAPNTTAPATRAVPVVHRNACTASMPASWRDAAAAHTTVFPGSTYGQVSIVGIAGDGTVVAEYTAPGTPAGTMALTFGAVSLDSGTIRPFATISGSGDSVGSFHQLEGDTLLVGTRFTRGQGPTSAAPTAVTVIDIRTGEKTRLMQLHGKNPTGTDIAFLQDGVAYWDEYPSANHEVVYAYDVATGARTVAYDGPSADSDMGHSAAGTWWTGSALAPNRPTQLPAAVSQHTGPAERQFLTTDGSSFAWRTNDSIGWWGEAGTVVQTQIRNDGVADVAGPLVVFRVREGKYSQMRLLDTRTGAVVALGRGPLAKEPLPPQINTVSSHGLLLVDRSPSYVTNLNDQTDVTRLDTSSLPEARC